MIGSAYIRLWLLLADMRATPSSGGWGVALSGLGFAAGFGVGGIDAAVLGAMVGFFLGKSLRSTLRTFAVDEQK